MMLFLHYKKLIKMTEYDIEESTHDNLTCYDAAPWSDLKFSKKIDYWLLMCL